MQGGSCFWYLRAMPKGRQTGIFPAKCNAGWKLFLVLACNAERSANRNFPCGVQCRVEAVFGTCVQCRTLGKQEFSLRSAMQGGSCFLYLRAMPNARQTGIFPAECNAGWELLTAVIEVACLPLACLLLFPQVQVERPLRFLEMFLAIFFRSSTFAHFKGIGKEYRAGCWLLDAGFSLIATFCHGWEGS